jgi:hypothetical protein
MHLVPFCLPYLVAILHMRCLACFSLVPAVSMCVNGQGVFASVQTHRYAQQHGTMSSYEFSSHDTALEYVGKDHMSTALWKGSALAERHTYASTYSCSDKAWVLIFPCFEMLKSPVCSSDHDAIYTCMNKT